MSLFLCEHRTRIPTAPRINREGKKWERGLKKIYNFLEIRKECELTGAPRSKVTFGFVYEL